MTWAPVTMRWPEQATAWIGDLSAAKDLAGHELASTAQRLAGLNGLVSTNPGLSATPHRVRSPPAAPR